MNEPRPARLWWTWLAAAVAALVGASCLFATIPAFFPRCEPDGSCPDGGLCTQGTCLPRWMACGNCVDAGKNCGLMDDGCGEQLLCGDCALPETCGGSGEANVCGCPPISDAELCGDAGTYCGLVSLTDNCGAQRPVDCGGCDAGATCGGAQAGLCCYPETNAQTATRIGAECGTFDAGDGCGGIKQLFMGPCTDGGFCTPATHQCHCHDLGFACSVDAGCCLGLACVSSLCCKPPGFSCGDPAECCGQDECSLGVCCRKKDAPCTQNSDCCSLRCTPTGVNGATVCF